MLNHFDQFSKSSQNNKRKLSSTLTEKQYLNKRQQRTSSADNPRNGITS